MTRSRPPGLMMSLSHFVHDGKKTQGLQSIPPRRKANAHLPRWSRIIALRQRGGLVRRRSAREGPVSEPVINYFARNIASENSSFTGDGSPRKQQRDLWQRNKQTNKAVVTDEGKALTSQGAPPTQQLA